MNLSDVGGVITLAIAIVAFVGTAAVFLRGSADKGTITSLTSALGALKEEMAARDLEHARESAEKNARIKALEEANESKEQKIFGLGREMAALRNTVTQADEIAKLQETLDAHHNEAREHWERIEEAVTR